MAIARQGAFGIISGKVGNLVGYSYRGRQAFRALPKKSTKAPSLLQQAQRMRFGLMINFLNPLRSITSKGYGKKQVRKSQAEQCFSYNAKHAVKGIFPNLEIDYGKIALTTGMLFGIMDGEVLSTRAKQIDFSWVNRKYSNLCNADDEVILVAYNPSDGKHELLRNSTVRASQEAVLEVPMEFSGQRVHCWIIFVKQNGEEFSNSSYLGYVTVI